MSTICAYKRDGIVSIASDTGVTWDDTKCTNAVDGKWVGCGGWWIGCVGSYRSLFLISQHKSELISAMSVAEMSERLRRLLKDDWYQSENNRPGPLVYPEDFIIVRGRDIWNCNGDFAPSYESPVAACGSGYRFALGAFEAMMEMAPGMVGIDVAKIMVQAAIARDLHTHGHVWATDVG